MSHWCFRGTCKKLKKCKRKIGRRTVSDNAYSYFSVENAWKKKIKIGIYSNWAKWTAPINYLFLVGVQCWLIQHHNSTTTKTQQFHKKASTPCQNAIDKTKPPQAFNCVKPMVFGRPNNSIMSITLIALQLHDNGYTQLQCTFAL